MIIKFQQMDTKRSLNPIIFLVNGLKKRGYIIPKISKAIKNTRALKLLNFMVIKIERETSIIRVKIERFLYALICPPSSSIKSKRYIIKGIKYANIIKCHFISEWKINEIAITVDGAHREVKKTPVRIS